MGRSLAGWQFMQRGLIITFAASVNKARERAGVSAMLEKPEGARSSVGLSCLCVLAHDHERHRSGSGARADHLSPSARGGEIRSGRGIKAIACLNGRVATGVGWSWFPRRPWLRIAWAHDDVLFAAVFATAVGIIRSNKTLPAMSCRCRVPSTMRERAGAAGGSATGSGLTCTSDSHLPRSTCPLV